MAQEKEEPIKDQKAEPPTPSDKVLDKKREHVKFTFSGFWRSLVVFLKEVLSLQDGVDKEDTMKGIRDDVEFKGHAAWILICSIMIASIGLNINSIPIVIGAMLISPLMGPILGIGLGAGINDWQLLIKSAKNLAVAVGISLVISTLYFILSPVKEASFELVDRTNATVLALVVAFFGGVAGIIAGSRPLKSNVVPGVAIATALMPPLCTAGYGLATLQWDFFLAAMYLFFINSVAIALPTTLYIKYMRFPVKEFLDPLREKKIKRYVAIVIVLIITPSAYIFYNVLQKSIYERNAQSFITQIELELEGSGTSLITSKVNSGSVKEIRLAFMGDHIPERTISRWQNDKTSLGIECDLKVIQGTDIQSVVSNVEAQNESANQEYFLRLVDKKDADIIALRDSINRMKSVVVVSDKNDQLLNEVNKEVKALFPDLARFGFAKVEELNQDGQLSGVPVVFVEWNNGTATRSKGENEAKIRRWLMAKLGVDELMVLDW